MDGPLEEDPIYGSKPPLPPKPEPPVPKPRGIRPISESQKLLFDLHEERRRLWRLITLLQSQAYSSKIQVSYYYNASQILLTF